jgi:hypothetical protein
MTTLFRRIFLGLALALCSPIAAFAQLDTYNYDIGSPSCTPLEGVTAKVKFTQTVITNGVGGNFGFQLNAWSLQSNPDSAPFVGFQQYMTGVNVNPAFVNPTIQTFQSGDDQHWAKSWGLAGGLLTLTTATLTPPDGKGVLVIPGGYAIIAGTELTIGLQNDKDGAITGATFGAADVPNGVLPGATASGQPLSSASYSENLSAIPGPVQQNHPAPIVGFQFEFNGGTGNVLSVPPWVTVPADGKVPVGTITYTASSPMTVWSNFPVLANGTPCVTTQAVTLEITNSYYEPLTPAASPSQTLTQTFGLVIKQPSPFNVTYPGQCPPEEICSTCPKSCGLAGCYLPKPGPNGVVWECKK